MVEVGTAEVGTAEIGVNLSVDVDVDLVTFLGSEVRKAYADALKRNRYVTFEDPLLNAESDVDPDDSIGGSFISDSYFPQDWDRMTIDDVLQSARSLLLEAEDNFEVEGDQTSQTSEQSKLGDKWTGKITVPQPFTMTIREETNPQYVTNTYSQKFLDKLLEAKKLELAAQASYPKFKAKPVPPTTYLPLYDELTQKSEQRRQFIKEYCKEALKNKLKPFNLTKSKGIFAHSRRCTSMENLNGDDQYTTFKARPVPDEVISKVVDVAMKQQEMERLQNRRQRADELLKLAQLPPNMQVSKFVGGITDTV